MKYVFILILFLLLFGCYKSIPQKESKPTLEISDNNKDNEIHYKEKKEIINIENEENTEIIESVMKDSKKYLMNYFCNYSA
jgi:hypothetical protein